MDSISADEFRKSIDKGNLVKKKGKGLHYSLPDGLTGPTITKSEIVHSRPQNDLKNNNEPVKKSKFKSTKVIIDDIIFDSIKEGNRYNELKLLKAAGVVLDFELQPKYQYQVTYSLPDGNSFTVNRMYKGDFLVHYPDYSELEDVKGFRTREYKQKKKIIKKLYGIEIIEK